MWRPIERIKRCPRRDDGLLTFLRDSTAAAYFPFTNAFIPTLWAGYQEEVFAQMNAASLNVYESKNGGAGMTEKTLTSPELMMVACVSTG